mgnify:CR=1 FL=1
MPTKEQYQKNKEYYTEYNEKNKEHIKEQRKKRYKTDTFKKSCAISNWKKRGLICDNYEELYDKYINTLECDNCAIELVTGHYGANRRCMDHDHITGKFRNILCHYCNTQRGKDDRSNN